MKIAAAQIRSAPGDIEGNIERHVRVIERAASRGSAAVFFPEMSLTAYEPRRAEQLAMTEADARLDVLQALSDRHQMLIAVGAPYRGVQGPEIGMFIFRSRQARALYSKQMLHADERPYFTPGTRILPLTLGADTLVPAICFESLPEGNGAGGEAGRRDGVRCQRGETLAWHAAGLPSLRDGCAGTCDGGDGVQWRGSRRRV
ncbi:carbon-nitrogen hydrolase family protein [Stenotrophomonas maltophilia]